MLKVYMLVVVLGLVGGGVYGGYYYYKDTQSRIQTLTVHTKLEKANEYRNTLIGKLRKHNLAKLSLQKPGLVEKKINNGTKKLFRSLEKISGAEPPLPSTSVK